MTTHHSSEQTTITVVNLNELVEESAQQLEHSLADNIELRFHFAVNIPAIKAEPDEVSQVVSNLITNACEAIGKEAGTVTCTTGSYMCDRAFLQESLLQEKPEEGPYVFLEVSDTGPGIDYPIRQHMLEPNFGTKPNNPGLGLSAVMDVIRSRQGALKVNTAPGLGTTFTALFPALPRPAMKLQEPRNSVHAWKGQGTILLVDDAKTCLAIGGRLLENSGFKVLKAERGEEAISLLRSNRADTVVLDLVLPDMDGRDVLHELRRIQSNIPIIISSGVSEEELWEKFREEDISGFVQKPYQAWELLNKVREISESRAQNT